jgi:uncharacterized protein YciI
VSDQEPLRRLGGGRWQTRDERFTIEPGDGTWSLVDAGQTDELGLPLVRGPFRSLAAAKAAIVDARGGAAPASPLAARSESIQPLSEERRARRRVHEREGPVEAVASIPQVDESSAAAPGPIEEFPAGLRAETLYAIEAPYTTEAHERRPAVRRAHLDHAAELMAAGTLVEAGGFADLSSAWLLVRAADEAEALALVKDDVYVRAGVWTGDFRIRPFVRVVRDPT